MIYHIGRDDTDLDTQHCPFYKQWRQVFDRCYDTRRQAQCPVYRGCSVHPDWHNFSSFLDWMITQDWHGKVLNHSLLANGSKVLGPDTCAFVDRATVAFINENQAHQNDLPLGVCVAHEAFGRPRYRARCGNPFTKKRESLGVYSTPEQAHQAWKERKHELAKQLAAQETDPRVQQALLSRYL